jgi:hypothetical protein
MFSGNYCGEVGTKRRKTVKRQNFCGVKLEYYYLPAGGTVSLHNGPLQLRLHGRIKPVCGAG